jgi:hypothetical protein
MALLKRRFREIHFIPAFLAKRYDVLSLHHALTKQPAALIDTA